MNLYRVKYGIDYGGASSGQWKYYENVGDMKADLLIASLDLSERGKFGPHLRILRAWRNRLSGNYDTFPKYDKIYAVEKVDNDTWVPVEFRFTPPEVHLD